MRRAQFDLEADDSPPQQQRLAVRASEESGDDGADFPDVKLDGLLEDCEEMTLQEDDAQE